jgi:two-component system sensor kinase
VPKANLLGPVPRRLLIAAGAGLVLVLVIGTALVLARLRAEALERSEVEVATAASAFAGEVRESVRALERVLRATARELAAGPQPAGQAAVERLRASRAELPWLRALAFLDARGDLVLHSEGRPRVAVNYGGRDDFRAHREGAAPRFRVGEPAFGGERGEWLALFSHRVEREGGEFLGVLVAMAVLPAFDAARAAAAGGGLELQLFRADGVLLAARPAVSAPTGKTYSGDALFSAQAGRSGVLRRAGVLDSAPRVLAFERVEPYALVLVAAAREDAVLAPWRREALWIGAGAVGVGALIVLALGVLLRQLAVDAALRRELQQTAERLDGIIASAMDAVITVDEGQRIVLFNRAAETIFRCPAAEAIGGPLERFIPERFREAHRAHIERFGATGVTTRAMGAQLDLRGLRADGEEFPMDASISQITIEGRKLYTVIVRDITERRRAQEELERSYRELRELAAAMNEVREAERTRIARELHDELAQWLTALKMDVSWLAAKLPEERGGLRDRAERMKQLVDTIVGSVRRIAADLRPAMLDDLGLVPAIEHLVQQHAERTGTKARLDADSAALDFGEPVATSVYRMVQEALTNVARHAEASEVEVSLRHEDGTLLVRVRDNGKGYDPQAAARRKSYGLLGIRERAQTLGGSARIARLGSGGTLVEIAIPTARYRLREGRRT